MIDRIIELSLRNKFLVVMLWIGIAGWGLWAMLRAPIDAIPDLSDNQVIVFTDWSGRSPQEVEDQITYPVPGVAEVASVGGTVQQYQIDVDPNRLRSYGVPLSMVMRAVIASNSNVGGNVIAENGSWSIVRGLGLIENLDDIRNIVVGEHNGTTVFLTVHGTVKIGDAFRTAALVKNSSEAVGGVI